MKNQYVPFLISIQIYWEKLLFATFASKTAPESRYESLKGSAANRRDSHTLLVFFPPRFFAAA